VSEAAAEAPDVEAPDVEPGDLTSEPGTGVVPDGDLTSEQCIDQAEQLEAEADDAEEHGDGQYAESLRGRARDLRDQADQQPPAPAEPKVDAPTDNGELPPHPFKAPVERGAGGGGGGGGSGKRKWPQRRGSGGGGGRSGFTLLGLNLHVGLPLSNVRIGGGTKTTAIASPVIGGAKPARRGTSARNRTAGKTGRRW